MPFVVNARSRKLNFRLIRMRSPVELESCTIRSRSQVDSDSQADGTQGERLCFPPFPSASRNFLAPKAGGHMVQMSQCILVYIWENTSLALIVSQSRLLLDSRGCWMSRLLDAHKPSEGPPSLDFAIWSRIRRLR